MADFPGTTKRAFFGFYFGADFKVNTATQANNIWNTYLDAYKTDWTIPGEVYIGLTGYFGWGEFYTDTNTRPTDPQDPDDPGYDWSMLDNVLDGATFLNAGEGKLLLHIKDRSHTEAHPDWVRQSPYNAAWGTKNWTAYHRASASTELAYFYEAFGKRYANDTRIGAIKTTEIVRVGETPTDWAAPIGGGSGGYTEQAAYDQGSIIALGALQANMPNTVVIRMTADPRLAYGVQGNPGTVDLGLGAGMPDVRAFHLTCGTGGDLAVDCGTNTAYWVMQAERDNVPVYMNAEPNGWNIYYWEGDDPWDKSNPWGYTSPADKPDINASIYMWYCSGHPKAASPDDDSGLGQVGTDPPGVIPCHYIGCNVRGGVTGTEWADWVAAINTFGPPGTQAAPYYPPGFPGQGGQPDPDVATVRVNAGDVSYVDPVTGQQWASDAVYTSETGVSILEGSLLNGTGYPDALFTKARLDAGNDNVLFTISGIEDGTYTVTLGFVETWSGASVGTRVFHIDIQGSRVETDYDILDQTGALYTATTKEYAGIVVDAGTLTIDLIDTAANRPHISFIEVTQQIVEAQFAAEEETSPGVYVDRTTAVSPVMAGQINIDIDKASVTDWSAVVFKVVSKQVSEQVRNVKLRTNV